jgi:hypothetical protein
VRDDILPIPHTLEKTTIMSVVDEAWSIFQDNDNALNCVKFKSFKFEVGLNCINVLPSVGSEDHTEISSYLKRFPKKRYLQLMTPRNGLAG